MVPTLASAALAPLLLAAAWRDVLTRTIPDRLAIAIAAIGLAVRLADGVWPALLSLAAAALVFAFLLLLAVKGWLGGGDVKLASALAIGLPPLETCDFLVLTILAGGVLGVGYLAGRRIAQRQPRRTKRRIAERLARDARRSVLGRIRAVEAWRIRRGGPLPYGVAIGVGAMLAQVMGE